MNTAIPMDMYRILCNDCLFPILSNRIDALLLTSEVVFDRVFSHVQ